MPNHPWNLADKVVELDPELKRIALAEGMSYDDKVRNACMLLEQRVRKVAGLEAHDFGTDLIKKVFGDKGIFDSVSPVPAENIGLMNLFLGTVLYYRNPVSHRAIYHNEASTLHVLSLINHLLFLLERASSTAIDAKKFWGFHEGTISHRRDFRVDINGDGVKEVIILLSASGIIRDGKPGTHLLPVVLKPDGDSYRRIPCEVAWDGESMYGPMNVMVHDITGQSSRDIVAVWALGETQDGFFIFRRDGIGYVRVTRDVSGYYEPYGGASPTCFLEHNAWKHVQFVDYDGDGQVEIIQRLSFGSPYDVENLPDKREQTRSRVWKWDAASSELKCVLDCEMDHSVMHSSF